MFNEEIREKEKTIREQWLKYSIFYCLGYSFFVLTIYALVPFFFPIELTSQPWQSVEELIESIIFFSISYHFAYKKFGTKWLTWCLMVTPLMVFFYLVRLLKPVDTLGTLLGAIDIVLYIGWYLLTWKVRKANKRIQLRHQVSDNSKLCSGILEGSSSLEELNTHYYRLMQQFPLLEPILSDSYKAKRDLLKSRSF